MSNVIVHKLIFFVSIKEIKNKIVKFDEFVKTKMFFDDIIDNKIISIIQSITNIINVKIHVINNFVVNLLLNNNVIYSQNMKLNLKKHRLIIIKYEKLYVLLKIRNCVNFHVKRIIQLQRVYTFMFDNLIEISIIYYNLLSNNRNSFFEFQCQYNLKYEKKVYVHVVDNTFFKMFVRNIIDKSITLIKRVKLETIIKYNQVDCYLTISKKSYKAIND